MNKMYQALKKGLAGQPKFIPLTDKILPHISEPEKSWFVTLYKYSQDQVEEYKKNGKIKGIRGATTNQLFFDFDSTDLNEAKENTANFIGKLIEDGFPEDSLQLFYSGGKGFSIHVDLSEFITHEQFVSIIKQFHIQYKLDPKIIGPNQIMRVANTKHDSSGLFKIPLDIDEILSLSIKEIKELAKKPRYLSITHVVAKLPASYKNFTQASAPKKLTEELGLIDYTNKPKDWRNCKWSLLQGNFKSGERHQALTILAATAKGLGYDRETAYYFCKSAIKKQARLHDSEEFSTDEVWENILESIYAHDWKGGQYSCKSDLWLQSYCEGLNEHKCKNDKNLNPTIQIEEAFDIFKDYAQNIDKLTIKSGIPVLDKNLRMTIGMSVGIVASAGVGKTSIALQMLNSMSKREELCLFLSYDMFGALVYQKLVQKHTGKEADIIFNKFKAHDPAYEKEINDELSKEYKNVEFCFDAGQSIEDIENTIKAVEEKRGKKIRFIIVDYNELIITDKSDGTASSAYVAQSLRKIAKVHNCCVLSLLQPSKASGSPSDEINSYRAAKGSSAIEQSVSVMLGMSRPGYDPKRPEEDKFITIGCLKNRMGKIFSVDLFWNGLTGTVREMTQEEKGELQGIRQRRKEEKEGDSSGDWK